MGRFSEIQHNFLAGELSPRLRNRLDIEEYKQGVSSLINFIPQSSGGVSYRAGFQYKATLTPRYAEPPSGVEYHDDTSISYKLSFDTRNATPASRIVITKNDGTTATIAGVYGDPYANLALVTMASWSHFYGWRFAQAGSLLFITHTSGLMKPLLFFKKDGLLYLAEYDAAINIIPGNITAASTTKGAYLKVPYLPINGQITMAPTAAALGSTTLTSSVAIFVAGHVGMRFRSKVGTSGTVEGLARITAVPAGAGPHLTCTIEVELAFAATTATTAWSLSAWGTKSGWPKYVTFWDGRLLFASNEEFKDYVWASERDNIFNFMAMRLVQDSYAVAPAVPTDVSGLDYYSDDIWSRNDSDPIDFYISTNMASTIKWVSSGRSLSIGTDTEEISVDELNALNLPTIKAQTNIGSGDCNVVRVFNSTFYVARGGKKIYEFSWSEENGSYLSRELTLLNNDILDNGIDTTNGDGSLRIMSLSWNPSTKIVWALVGTRSSTGKSRLVGFSYDKSANLRGWFRIDTGYDVYDISNLNESSGLGAETWILVKRVINASSYFFLEKISYIPNGTYLNNGVTVSNDQPIFLDSSKYATGGVPGLTPSGFAHLASQEVSVIVDNVYIGEKTVSAGGVITLDVASTSSVLAGFKYTAILKTMNIEAGGRIGNAQILFKKIDRIQLPMYRSMGGYYGFRTDNLNPIEYPDDMVGYYTGNTKALDYDSSAGEEQHIYITKNDPTQFNLLGILFRGMTED